MPFSSSHTPATRLLLVRHAATTMIEEGRFSGDTGVELSETGREQAARLAERLEPLEIDAVYSSPLSRARDTAHILAAPHRLEVVENPELREISSGHWVGLTRAGSRSAIARSTRPGRPILSCSRRWAAKPASLFSPARCR